MLHIEKLLVVGSLVQKAYGRRLLHRVVSRILVVSGLTIVLSLLVGAMLLCGFYAGYIVLVANGVMPHMAMLFIMGALAFMSLVVGLIIMSILRHMPRNLAAQDPLGFSVSRTVDAFLDGLLDEKRAA